MDACCEKTWGSKETRLSHPYNDQCYYAEYLYVRNTADVDATSTDNQPIAKDAYKVCFMSQRDIM